MNKLTARQVQVLEIIRRHSAERGMPPTRAEIAAELGLPGVLLWAAVIFMGFKTLLVFVQSDPGDRDRAYAYALGISIAGYLVSAMFVTLEYETLYFLLGMTAAVGFQLENPVRFTRRDAIAVTTVIGGFFVALRLFVAIYY